MDSNSSSSLDSDDDEIPEKPNRRSKAKLETGKNSARNLVSSESEMAIDDSTVVYHLYLTITDNSAASASTVLEELISVQAFAFKLSQNYIWACQPFRLFYSADPKPHFVGITNYGDTIEDEWFIVYILYEISKKFPHIVIRVADSDGQFQLIEAADYIPAWLDDDEADNRVFIFRGALHFIPFWKQLTRHPRSLSNSVYEKLLNENPGQLFSILDKESLTDQLLASDKVRGVIQKRTEGYPQRIQSQRHGVNCVLPAKLAAILAETGSIFIPPSVNLACQEMKEKVKNHEKLPFSFSSADLVTTSVVFSKHLYAKLSSSRYKPNYNQFGWKLPKHDEFGYKANELGMKLTKGFQLLMNEARKKPGLVEMDEISKKNWEKFQQMLVNSNSIQDSSGNSNSHHYLMANAKLNFLLQMKNSNQENFYAVVGGLLVNILNEMGAVDIETVRRHFGPQEEDDDSWLTLTQDDLNALLSQRLPAKKSNQKNSSKISQSVRVVENGANSSLSSNQQSKQSSVVQKGTALNADSLDNSVRKMLDLHIPNDGDDSSDMESYGEETSGFTMDEKSEATSKAISAEIQRYLDLMEKNPKSSIGGMKKDQKQKKSNPTTSVKTKTVTKHSPSPSQDSIDIEDDDFNPVDIDGKAVTAMLASFFPETCVETGSPSSLLHGKRDRPTASKPK